MVTYVDGLVTIINDESESESESGYKKGQHNEKGISVVI